MLKTRLTRSEFLSFSGAFCLALASGSSRPLVPQIEGDWWQIAGQPSLGQLAGENQQPVDFSVWRADDGMWQLWSCIRNTKEPGNTRLFYRWESSRITNANWRQAGIAMRANPRYGETPGGLQAPYVFQGGHDYV